jgi:hypothetical protein
VSAAGPSRSTHNRQNKVLVKPHPDCRACASFEEKLEKQIVANGRLRLELYDLRRAYNRIATGRDYGLPDRTTLGPALDERAEPTCTHGIPMPNPCVRCGLVEE